MRAIVHHRYGSPDVLELRDVEVPAVAEDEVLVRVGAASVNPLDWHGVTGTPYVMRIRSGLRAPRDVRVGVDFAGTVEAVGASVERFRPGDDVFGARTGAFAEQVAVPVDRAAPKPAGLTFEQAAAVPVAALTALQGLRDRGGLRAGQKVLVNGASGGVGTFAVQIAKALGADVTGVCSPGNVGLVRSLGADAVVDYTREDFTLGDDRYDVLLDVAGSRSWSECTRVLAPGAKLVVVSGPKTNRWLGPLTHLARMRLASMRGSRRAVPFLTRTDADDLTTLAGMIEAGAVTPVIDRTYRLDEARDALRYLGEGHARGKVVLVL
jgi:NADPH:quinone reductase-like Zn-dependent oxidoreductase